MSKFTNKLKEKFSLKNKQSQPEPRSSDAINKEYSKTIGEVGQAQYLVYVYTQQVEQLNRRLYDLNQEAAERAKLDKQASSTDAAPAKEASNG